MECLPSYSVAIRTLGLAGEKYKTLLKSLENQTHKPNKIFIYLAEGYERPKETIGKEEVIYTKKGMVAQRALPYNEVETEWILFLDDDIEIKPNGIENLFFRLLENDADVIAVDAFPHNTLPFHQKILMAILGSSIPRLFGNQKGYRINVLGSDVYNNRLDNDIAWSTTNAGMAFLCRKQDFINIHFEEDLWLDEAYYAIPEDKVMFYKMHLIGLKILTYYKQEFIHLDAGSTLKNVNVKEKRKKITYSIARNNYIFQKLYLVPNLKLSQRMLRYLLLGITTITSHLYYLAKSIKGENYLKERLKGKKDAKQTLDTLLKLKSISNVEIS